MSNLIPGFRINSIVEYHTADGNVEVLRILATFPQDNALGVVNIFEKNAWPFLMDLSGEETRDAIQPVAFEPYKELLMLDDSLITPARLKNRDNAWKIMKPIIFSAQGILRQEWFSSDERARLINARAKELREACPKTDAGNKVKKNSNNTAKPRTIAKYARQMFVRGLYKNSLLNDYHKVGTPKANENGSTKRLYKKRPGRKPADIHLYEDSSYGIIVTEKIEKYFKAAIDSGLRRRETLEDIYTDILDKHFSSGVDEKGRFIHLPHEFCPTYRQFEYYYSKLRAEDPTKYEMLRHGTNHFRLNTRSLTGKSMFMVDGPGAVYQGDSTPLPFALVSALNRKWIIGIQHLYTIIDCFSEMYVGWSLDYRQSWNGARSALLCAFTNKEHLLQKYGLSDLLDAFPAEGICRQLVVDNGPEWTGHNSDNIPELQSELANPEAYRPDLKGGVEALLGSLQSRLKNVPGSLFYRKERGEKDPRLAASRTRHELMRMLICEMAEHNRHRWIEFYPLRRQMIAKEIKPIPIDLWHYGITDISGPLPMYPEEYLSKTFLPRDSATIDRHGILYKKRHYVSETALASQMLVKVKLKGTQKVTISYDPDNVSAVYLHLENGELEECKLSQADQAYNTASWDDLDALSLHYNLFEKAESAKRRQGRSDMKVVLQAEQAKAAAETAAARKGTSTTAILSGIAENAEREKKYEKNQEVSQTSSTVVEQPASRPIKGYVALPDYQDEIDKLSDHSEQEHQNDQ